MTALRELQSRFQQHLLEGSGAIGADIASRHGIATARRLHVYHHAYRARLVDALRDTFGHTATYLGCEWFGADALTYVESHPSSGTNLNGYGGDFAAWLQSRYARDPEIAELAALDWHLRRAFDGPDSPLLTLAQLAAVAPHAWSRVGFSVVPTGARLSLACNTLALWHAIDRDETPPKVQALAAPHDLLIWRRGHRPHFRSLGDLEAFALSALCDGLPFAVVCDHVAACFPQVDAVAETGTLLRRWIDEELLSARFCAAGRGAECHRKLTRALRS